MEIYEVQKRDNWTFKIRLPKMENYQVMFPGKDLEYNVYARKYVYTYVDWPLYFDVLMTESEIMENELVFYNGFAPVILSMFSDKLSNESKAILSSLFFDPVELKREDVANLYNDQYEDLMALLNYRQGLFQCFTGYGKTELISTFINWILTKTEDTVLVVAPGQGPVNEIKARLRDQFGIQTGYIDFDSRVNVVNVKGALRSYAADWSSDYWAKVKWLIADEVEYCITPTFLDFVNKSKLENVRCYGFSATAERKFADPIRTRIPDDFYSEWMKGYSLATYAGQRRHKGYQKAYQNAVDSIKATLGTNKSMVGIFGTTIVYKKPRDKNINLYNIKADVFNREYIDAFEHKGDAMVNATIELECQPKLVTLIQNIVFRHGLTFVPIAFYDVADVYITRYFKKYDFIIAFMYANSTVDYFCMGEHVGRSDYDGLKEIVNRENSPVGVILATAAAYRAIDLQGLGRVLLLFSDTASIVLQIIGRARNKNLDIFNIINTDTISYYTKQLNNRLSMLRSYYSECKIHEYELTSSNYGIN